MQDEVPQGAELPSTDQQDLLHQLQVAGGLQAPSNGGLTIVPRIDLQQELTDNVLQQHRPRRFDLGTFLAPGIGVAADTSRLKATFDVSPVLSLYARTGSLNQLSTQANGLGSVTLFPELAYVDLRAVSGVRGQYGGVSGLGTLGVPADGGLPGTPTIIPDLSGNSFGLTKDNSVQTSSFGVSPYMVRRFGDWGNGRVGYSFDATRSDTQSGFAAAPFAAGGGNGQLLITDEETVHYETGDFLPRVKNSIDLDLLQRQAHADTGTPLGDGTPAPTSVTSRSNRTIFTDTITYPLNHQVALFASGGHEDISYSDQGFQAIHDLTWSIGTTLTPDPDSQITMDYGHRDGFNSFSGDARYALTARTMLTASYGTSLGTQLETVQNQLNLAAAGSAGNLVNAQTGAPLFGNIRTLPVQDGVFRTTNVALGSRTIFARDIVTFDLLLSQQSSAGAASASKVGTKTIGASWVHQLQPMATVRAGVSVAWQTQSGFAGSNPGDSVSVIGSLGWEYQISETLLGGISYSLFRRQSETASFSVLQNLIIASITKKF